MAHSGRGELAGASETCGSTLVLPAQMGHCQEHPKAPLVTLLHCLGPHPCISRFASVFSLSWKESVHSPIPSGRSPERPESLQHNQDQCAPCRPLPGLTRPLAVEVFSSVASFSAPFLTSLLAGPGGGWVDGTQTWHQEIAFSSPRSRVYALGNGGRHTSPLEHDLSPGK